MTPHLIIILSLSASTVGFALLALWYRGAFKQMADAAREALSMADQALDGEQHALIHNVVAADRINAALACLTPHSANIGKKMARKLRGEA